MREISRKSWSRTFADTPFGAPMERGFLGLTAAPPLRVLVGALQKKGRQFGLNLYNRAFARGKQANRPAGEGEAPFGG